MGSKSIFPSDRNAKINTWKWLTRRPETENDNGQRDVATKYVLLGVSARSDWLRSDMSVGDVLQDHSDWPQYLKWPLGKNWPTAMLPVQHPILIKHPWFKHLGKEGIQCRANQEVVIKVKTAE